MLTIANGTAKRNPPGHDRPGIGAIADLPVGFDPRQYPIIARHIFGGIYGLVDGPPIFSTNNPLTANA